MNPSFVFANRPRSFANLVVAGLLLLGALLVDSGATSAAPERGEGQIRAKQAVTGVTQKVHGSWQGTGQPPAMTYDQMVQRKAALGKTHQPLPAVPTSQAAVSGPAPAAATVTGGGGAPAPALSPMAPITATANDLGPNTTSAIDEPSVASDGTNVLETWNWYSAISANNGSTWTYYNPATLFPNDYGGWCCDSVAIYEASRDIFVWNLQYVASAAGGAYRLAVANGGAGLVAASFTYWDLTPQQIGSPAGNWYDYPKIAVSSGYLYLQANEFTGSNAFVKTVVMRFSLDDLATGVSPLNYTWTGTPNVASIAFSNGATGTMYFAGHLSASSLRVFSWPETSTTISWNDVSHTSFPTNAFSCPRTGVPNSNWCSRSDTRPLDGWVANGVIGFSWNASQGQWGFTGTAPYPYTHITRVNEATKAYIDDPVVWNGGYAFMYMSHYPNATGDLGGSFEYGGGSLFESGGVYIWDALGRDLAGIVGGSVDEPTGGDYLQARFDGTRWVGTMYAPLTDGVHPYQVLFSR